MPTFSSCARIARSSASFAAILIVPSALNSRVEDPDTALTKALPRVKFELYAEAPGYPEGPTGRGGEVYFCSGSLLRIDAKKTASKSLETTPAGTVLRGDGHLLV